MRILCLSCWLNVLSPNSKGDIRVRNVRFFETLKKKISMSTFGTKKSLLKKLCKCLCNQEIFLSKIRDKNVWKIANWLKIEPQHKHTYPYHRSTFKISNHFKLHWLLSNNLSRSKTAMQKIFFISQNRKEIFNFKIKNVIKWTAQLCCFIAATMH